MIAASHSQCSNEYQIGIGFFLLASGASRAEFEVLQHARLVASYPTTLRQLKKLSGIKSRLSRALKEDFERTLIRKVTESAISGETRTCRKWPSAIS
jgi:hypothetical protein